MLIMSIPTELEDVKSCYQLNPVMTNLRKKLGISYMLSSTKKQLTWRNAR